MTKISLAEWKINKTIRENAEHFGVSYNHASVIARENHLNFNRSNSGRPARKSNISEYKFYPVPTIKLKMYVNDGQTFEGSGPD